MGKGIFVVWSMRQLAHILLNRDGGHNSPPTHDIVSPTKIYFLKSLQLPKMELPANDEVFKHMSLG